MNSYNEITLLWTGAEFLMSSALLATLGTQISCMRKIGTEKSIFIMILFILSCALVLFLANKTALLIFNAF